MCLPSHPSGHCQRDGHGRGRRKMGFGSRYGRDRTSKVEEECHPYLTKGGNVEVREKDLLCEERETTVGD